MIVHEIVGNVQQIETGNRIVDFLFIEWFEATKRIQRKKTQSGADIAIKFMKEGQRLRHGDILYSDEEKVIVVDILPCDAIVIKPTTLYEMGSLCYEIGNKHLPIFLQDDEVVLPFEHPIFKWLTASGYKAEQRHTRLLNLLNSTVQPHGHAAESSSLFFKIMNIGK